jgi:peptidoglycan/LPS O-acetylase OafA/YrhL
MSTIQSPPENAEAMRKDIQGLRALAVALVVVFHLWPKALPGGFVGVDAFFVISGYLISAHLRRELDASGSIRLGNFWARRARRLLPASLTVLFVCLFVTWRFVPLSLWAKSLKDFSGAALYSLNWLLAADAVDYSAAEETASPVQHFWSLSVEEQFYLVWPLLIVGSAVLSRGTRGTPTAWVRGALGLIALGSFTASVCAAAAPSPPDYFVTWHRAWEFLAGALLAFTKLPRTSRSIATFLGLLGAGSLVAAAFCITGKMPFPGWLALVPVLGTVLALAFGQGSVAGKATHFSLERVLASRAIQWVGDASYSIYLWHWPLIVFSEELPERIRDSFWVRIGIIPLTLGLAWLSKRYVEDRVRFGSVLAKKGPLPTFGAAALGMGAVLAVVLAMHDHEHEVSHQRHPWVAAMKRDALPCFGANRQPGCVNPSVQGKLFPEPWAAHVDHMPYCMANNQGDVKLKRCKRGKRGKGVRFQTAIVGDSHAAHWSGLFEQSAEKRGEQVLQLMKGSCPFSMSERDSFAALRQSCEVIKRKIWAELRKNRRIRRVVLSASSLNPLVESPGLGQFESAVRGYQQMLQALPARISDVIVMRDVPRPRADVIQCLERLSSDARRLEYGACARPRSEALLPDPLAEAARRVGGRVQLIDFSDTFCDEKICSPVIGNVLAYRDGHHLTSTMAQSFGPRLREELRKFSKLELGH